jgi:hypothetical protein
MTDNAHDPLVPIEAMLASISPEAWREVLRATYANAREKDSPRERRVRELGALSEMLRALQPQRGWDFPTINQEDYDARRPASAPRGEWLASAYRGWLLACRAAYSMLPDGRVVGPFRPWQQPSESARGKPANAPYTREEVIAAVRQCWRELGAVPTSTSYARWSAEKRRMARQRGLPVRIPSLGVIYRCLHRAWGRVIATVDSGTASAPGPPRVGLESPSAPDPKVERGSMPLLGAPTLQLTYAAQRANEAATSAREARGLDRNAALLLSSGFA